MNGQIRLKQCKRIGLVNLGCEIDFKIDGLKELIQLNVIQQDLIHFLDFLFSFIVDHPVSKYYENNKDFEPFKKECSKTGTLKNQLQCHKNGFKQI